MKFAELSFPSVAKTRVEKVQLRFAIAVPYSVFLPDLYREALPLEDIHLELRIGGRFERDLGSLIGGLEGER